LFRRRRPRKEDGGTPWRRQREYGCSITQWSTDATLHTYHIRVDMPTIGSSDQVILMTPTRTSVLSACTSQSSPACSTPSPGLHLLWCGGLKGVKSVCRTIWRKTLSYGLPTTLPSRSTPIQQDDVLLQRLWVESGLKQTVSGSNKLQQQQQTGAARRRMRPMQEERTAADRGR
jgi:hypothetical protein